MEDDLNISKEEYLSHHWLDLPKFLNLKGNIGGDVKMSR
jgi:hypothetical protein